MLSCNSIQFLRQSNMQGRTEQPERTERSSEKKLRLKAQYSSGPSFVSGSTKFALQLTQRNQKIISGQSMVKLTQDEGKVSARAKRNRLRAHWPIHSSIQSMQ